MKLLLDTCALLWIAAEPHRLSPRAIEALDAPEARPYLSDASVWEIGLKWRTGKIRLPQPPRNWVEAQAQTWALAPLPISRRHVYRETELPEHHRDPFDRLLVAQAIEEGLTLLTPDPHIARYPVAVLW